MENKIFQPVALTRVSLTQRMFGQLPPDNALLELNNLLASKPPLSISKEDILGIERVYKINLAQEYGLNLQEFYAVLLNQYLLEDSTLSGGRGEALEHLCDLFALESKVVSYISIEIGKLIYRYHYLEIVSDGRISSAEAKELEELGKRLKLPKTITNQISLDVRTARITDYFNMMVVDQRISPAEENEFLKIAASLNINPNMNPETKELMTLYRDFWDLENLPLKEYPVEIELQKSEVCYLKVKRVNFCEPRSTRSSYGGTYEKLIDSGTLYLTQKRIIHLGMEKSRNIKLDTIIKTIILKDGILINKLTGRDPTFKMQPHEAEAMKIILKRLGLHR